MTSGEPVALPLCFFVAQGAAGAVGTRLSLRPLLSEGANFLHTSGAVRREKAESYSSVIASEAKQSNLSLLGDMDCFTSLAMTRNTR